LIYIDNDNLHGPKKKLKNKHVQWLFKSTNISLNFIKASKEIPIKVMGIYYTCFPKLSNNVKDK
jgi:hypothetical protein